MLAALSYEMESEKTVNDERMPRLYQNYSVNSLLHELMNIQMLSLIHIFVAFGDAPASCESQTVEELYQSNLHADKAVPIGKGMPGKLVGFPGWLMQIVD